MTRVGKLTYEGYRVKHIGQFLATSVAETRAEDVVLATSIFTKHLTCSLLSIFQSQRNYIKHLSFYQVQSVTHWAVYCQLCCRDQSRGCSSYNLNLYKATNLLIALNISIKQSEFGIFSTTTKIYKTFKVGQDWCCIISRARWISKLLKIKTGHLYPM